MNKLKTIAIIVTHNRSSLLKRCLINLKEQSIKVQKILVIDNGSTDNTQQILADLDVEFIKQGNLGSAGGWNTGLRYALKYEFDAAWLMDDDGYPDKKAYEILKNSFTKDMSCISSVIINELDKYKFVFPYPILNKYGIPKIGFNKPTISSVNKLALFTKDDLYPWTHLFNGALISIKSVKKIGNVNTDYFLYGDEVDYFFRLRKVGKIFSHRKAFHFHPAINKRRWSKTKVFYFLRNSLINYRKYYDHKLFRCTIGIFYLLFKVYQRNNLKGIFSLLFGRDIKIFYISIYEGLNNKLGIYNAIKE